MKKMKNLFAAAAGRRRRLSEDSEDGAVGAASLRCRGGAGGGAAKSLSRCVRRKLLRPCGRALKALFLAPAANDF